MHLCLYVFHNASHHLPPTPHPTPNLIPGCVCVSLGASWVTDVCYPTPSELAQCDSQCQSWGCACMNRREWGVVIGERREEQACAGPQSFTWHSLAGEQPVQKHDLWGKIRAASRALAPLDFQPRTLQVRGWMSAPGKTFCHCQYLHVCCLSECWSEHWRCLIKVYLQHFFVMSKLEITIFVYIFLFKISRDILSSRVYNIVMNFTHKINLNRSFRCFDHWIVVYYRYSDFLCFSVSGHFFLPLRICTSLFFTSWNNGPPSFFLGSVFFVRDENPHP